MLVGILAGCTKKEDPGAEIDVYLDETTNFDPAMAYNDQTSSQYLSLVYDSLTAIDEKGKVVPAMAKSWTVEGKVIEFKLEETRWSDGTYVDSSDFVYAWKRILDPEFNCDAASLLFYVENAVEVKNGDTSIDDVKIEASGKEYLTVTLKDAAFVDEFLYNCSSVALSPLRSDAVSKITVFDHYYSSVLDKNQLTSSSWATLNAVIVANGPFYVKKINLYEGEDKYITLERNKYYQTDPEKEEALRKFVEPYRINFHFVDEATALKDFESGKVYYNGKIALDSRSSYKSKVELVNNLATYSYMFNTTNPLFANAKVRQALSLAIDRTEIEKIVVFGKAADGLVSPGVFYTDRKTSFRDTAGKVISTTADKAKAKSLLSEAGVTSGEFKLSVRNNPVDIKVAEYVAAVWKELGFTVTVEALKHKATEYYEPVGKDSATGEIKVDKVYSNLCKDAYDEALTAGQFDVIGVDYAMLTTDAFASLAKFGVTYSGGAYDFSNSSDTFEKVPGASGYASTEYDDLITSVLKEKDDAKRAKLLVSAEKKLLEDMPITPVYYMQTGAAMSKNLKGVEFDYYGYADFTKAEDKEYKYTPVEALIPAKNWVID